ncbi:MAG TPA: imidazole glycerol phosphate synthase subunit HisH [Ignavibacteriaceae bacterium]|nr:imidazole glycerol phosphate synthase subunit HisH [Ignavibacteriaceae bacterium]
MLTIIDYGINDLPYIASAISEITSDFKITKNETDIMKSDRVILPGSKELHSSINHLHLLNLYSLLRICRRPVLGIGVGMLLMSNNIENDNTSLLGIFPESARQMENPIFGLEKIKTVKESKLLKGVTEEDIFYMDNSYYVPKNEYTTAVLQKEQECSAVMEKDNFFSVLFFPEKSGNAGKQILKNFIELDIHEFKRNA